MYQKYRPIVHTEQELIEECLMLVYFSFLIYLIKLLLRYFVLF